MSPMCQHIGSVVPLQPVAHPADQQRDIRPLPSAIGVQFVQDQKAQSLACSMSCFSRDSSHHELKHDVVGQENIRRIGDDALAFLQVFLTGIARKRNRVLTLRVAIIQELFAVPPPGCSPEHSSDRR